MNKRKKSLILTSVIVLSILITAVAFAAEPGSGEDPLVTKSYIDSLIDEVKSYVDEKVKMSNTGSEETPVNSSGSFEIVRLAQGQRITFSESTEFIVRMGKGSVIASEKGGIADVTAGVDLMQNEITSANHLLIVPVGDGRGFEALEDVIVMVKGGYQIN